MAKSRPKKLRGDAARAERLGKVAKEAAASALASDARNRTQRKMIATLVAMLGGDVALPFRLVAGAGELTTEVENPGTPDAAMRLRVGPAREGGGVIRNDRVIVHSWSTTLGATEPELTGLSWPGKVVQLDAGDLVVVELDEARGQDADRPARVIVPIGWVRYDASTRVDDLPALYPAALAEVPHDEFSATVHRGPLADVPPLPPSHRAPGQGAPGEHLGASVEDEDDEEKPDPCEGCGRPSTGSDPEGVPLCDDCGGPRGEANPSS